MLITGQSQNTETVSGFKTKSLLLTFRLYSSAANTALTLPAWANVNLQCTLTRMGKNHIIFNDNLQNLGVACQFEKGLEPMVNISYALERVAPASGVTASSIIPIELHLPGVLDLDQDDTLTLQVNVNPGCYSASGSSISISASTLDTYWIPTEGDEHAIPKINCQYIQSSVGTCTIAGGDHVSKVIIANYDKGLGATSQPSVTDANQVITNLNFNCKQFTRALSQDRLTADTTSHFESYNEAIFRGQCFKLGTHHGAMMDNVILNFNLNSGNVTASNNVVTFFSFEMDPHTHKRTQAKIAAVGHAAHQKLQSMGFNHLGGAFKHA